MLQDKVHESDLAVTPKHMAALCSQGMVLTPHVS